MRGHKPVAPYQTKYQWGHLYAALEVGGENSCEFFFSPTVSLEVSDFFLRQVAESDEDAHHVVIWDGAGFHPKTGSHPIPERIRLLQLPASSPELNPVEKLFDQLEDEPERSGDRHSAGVPERRALAKQIGNHLFDFLDDIEATITTLLASFWSDLRNVVSLIGNGWLLAQSNASANPYRPVIHYT